MTVFRIQPQSDGRFLLTGELDLRSARTALEQGEQLLGGERTITLDLSGLTRVDSAGLVMLLDWWRSARRQGRAFVLEHVPEQMRKLMAVTNLDRVLPVSD